MKSILLAAVLISGCASSYRVNPSMVRVTLQPTSIPCGLSDRKIPVVLHITNESRGVLKIGVWNREGPPFKVDWPYFYVLTQSGSVDPFHGPGDHGPLPWSTLRIGPGDSTTVSAAVYEVTPQDYAVMFKIRFIDLDGNSFTTVPFSPCIRQPLSEMQGIAPNNSFKPTPLRGAAQFRR